MEKATYKLLNGETITIEYDPEAPCRGCGLPVVSASVGGTDLCPWCDMGVNRDGSRNNKFDFNKIALDEAMYLGVDFGINQVDISDLFTVKERE